MNQGYYLQHRTLLYWMYMHMDRLMGYASCWGGLPGEVFCLLCIYLPNDAPWLLEELHKVPSRVEQGSGRLPNSVYPQTEC